MFYYAYNGIKTRPNIDELNMENDREIESWCRTAISMSDGFAEPYVILGDLYLRRGMVDRADACYLEALKKKVGRSGMQVKTFYLEIPSNRLSAISAESGNLERSIYYNKRCLECNETIDYINRRKGILERLVDNFSKKYCNAG
jgi:hypothetical protein